MLRSGPYGDRFGEDPEGLTLARLEESPHGVDLGALEPRLPERAAHPERQGRAGAGEQIVADVPGSRRRSRRGNGHIVLVGRRQLRSNNSWMHNLEPLVKGKDSLHTARPPRRRRARSASTDGAPARLRSAPARSRRRSR